MWWFNVFLLRRVSGVRLASGGRSFLVFVRPIGRIVVVTIVRIRPLVANSCARFQRYIQHGLGREFKGEGISVCQSFPVVFHFRRNFIRRAVTVPFVFFHVGLQRISQLLSRVLGGAKLQRNLSVRLSSPNDEAINEGGRREGVLVGYFHRDQVGVRRHHTKDAASNDEFTTVRDRPGNGVTHAPFVHRQVANGIQVVKRNVRRESVAAAQAWRSFHCSVYFRGHGRLRCIFLIYVRDTIVDYGIVCCRIVNYKSYERRNAVVHLVIYGFFSISDRSSFDSRRTGDPPPT